DVSFAAQASVEQSKSGKSKQGGKGKSNNSQTKTPAIKVIKKNKSEPLTPVQLEAEIAKAEERLNEISHQMSRPEVARNALELIKLDEQYRQAEARLGVLYS